MDTDEYCRAVEAYLCRKNAGQLIRIAGPAFERVCAWAERGVPLKIVFRGIDRFCERRETRGPSRRPVQIAFCEPDILELFDDWRRAVGIWPETSQGPADGASPRHRRRSGLASHLDRAIARLTARRLDPGTPSGLAEVLDRILERLEMMRAPAKSARGDTRRRLLEDLAELDRDLLQALRRTAGESGMAAARRESAAELESFRERMAEPAFERSLEAGVDRLLREQAGLPVLVFD